MLSYHFWPFLPYFNWQIGFCAKFPRPTFKGHAVSMLVPASHVAGNTSLHWCTHLQMKDNSWCCKLSQSLLTFQTVWYIVRSSSFQPNPRWRCPCSRCWWGRRPRSWNTRSYTPPWCGHCIGLKHSNFFLRTWSLAYDNLICYISLAELMPPLAGRDWIMAGWSCWPPLKDDQDTPMDSKSWWGLVCPLVNKLTSLRKIRDIYILKECKQNN